MSEVSLLNVEKRNTGPLAGLKIIEIAGIGPAPFCAMMLADMGAEVILVQRKSSNPNAATSVDPSNMGKYAIFNRGKKSIALDLKDPQSIEAVLKLVEGADALIEGFRPGVIERLGLGPEVCLARNPALIFARMTGWGQYGPLAHTAGHDINYIALSGALYHSGHRQEAPFAPPTVVGDIGGGGMMLALGILAAILSAKQSGQGQVIDSAVTDGSALLNTLIYSFHQMGTWTNQRSDNMLDGASPWYDTYECADGNYVTVGSLEPQFYSLLLDKCGLSDDPLFAKQFDKASWAPGKDVMIALFKTKSRTQWCEVMEGTDVCFAPVLNLEEAAQHPHNIVRETFVEIDGVLQPAPAPKFSATPSRLTTPPPTPGADSREILSALGYSHDEIESLLA